VAGLVVPFRLFRIDVVSAWWRGEALGVGDGSSRAVVVVVMAQRWLRGMVAHIGRPAMITRRKEGLVNPAGTPFVALASTFVGVLPMDRPLR